MIDSRLIAVALTGAIATAAQAGGTWNIAGEFQGWDNAAPAWGMADSGGNDIFELVVTLPTADPHLEYKSVETGNWGNAFPGSGNDWVNVPADNTQVTFTLDTNTYADGWLPAENRHYTSTQSLLTNWTAVGSFQGWDNANAATLMSDLGGGIYSVDYIVATAGNYEYKVTNTGGWDTQIGVDGPGVNSATLFFDTLSDNELVRFQMDINNGTIRVIPTPGTLTLLGLSGMAAVRRRR